MEAAERSTQKVSKGHACNLVNTLNKIPYTLSLWERPCWPIRMTTDDTQRRQRHGAWRPQHTRCSRWQDTWQDNFERPRRHGIRHGVWHNTSCLRCQWIGNHGKGKPKTIASWKTTVLCLGTGQGRALVSCLARCVSRPSGQGSSLETSRGFTVSRRLETLILYY